MGRPLLPRDRLGRRGSELGLRTRQPYVIRDLDGTEVTKAEGRRIVTKHHHVVPAVRAKNAGTRTSKRLKHRTSRVS